MPKNSLTPPPPRRRRSLVTQLFSLEAPPVTTISTFEELGHGLVAAPRLLLVVADFRGLALPAGVHRFAIINPDRLVHAIPILPFPV